MPYLATFLGLLYLSFAEGSAMDGTISAPEPPRTICFCAGGMLRALQAPDAHNPSKDRTLGKGSRAAHDGADSGSSPVGNWKNCKAFIEKWLSEQFQLAE